MEVIINNVSYIYNNNTKTEKKAIKDISLKFSPGIIYGITGKPGSGKTTLLEMINGNTIPTTGFITIDGILLTKKFRKFLNNKIGFISQYTEFLEETVLEEINYSLKNFDINKIIKSLNMVGLNETYLNRNVSTLSAGEQRLVAIASQLVKTPNLLIIDEPGLGLDRIKKICLLAMLKNINKKYKVTVILVSHDINLLNMIADELIILKDGKVLTEGTKDEVLKKNTYLKRNEIELPKILEFINMVQKEKNIKLGTYDDVKDLIKAVYRNA